MQSSSEIILGFMLLEDMMTVNQNAMEKSTSLNIN